MAMADQYPDDGGTVPRPRRRRLFRRVLGLAILLAVGLAIYGWIYREQVADSYISDVLGDLGVAATYDIERISPRHQVFANIVVGDPERPDLTIERLEAWIEPHFGLPAIGRMRVVQPRLFGSFRDGTLSFGALDPVIFPEDTDQPFELPDMRLELIDGRGLVESEYGPIGIKAEGAGNLRSGFDGILAAIAPALSVEGCAARRTTLYGRIGVDAERPHFTGPLRFATLRCPEMDLALDHAAIDLDMRVDRTFSGIQGAGRLSVGPVSLAGSRIALVSGETELAWRNNGLTAEYALDAGEATSGPIDVAALRLEGTLRSRDGFAAVELQGDMEGGGLRPGADIDAALASAADAASDSLLGPMLDQLRRRLMEEGRDSTLAASFTARRGEGGESLVIPTASLRGASGATLLALSRVQLGKAEGEPRFFGNFTTGGAGLPRIAGRMERQPDGNLALRLRMAEYRAGGGRLAIPEMLLLQGPNGVLGIAGNIEAGGKLPGGSVEGLRLPVSGNYSRQGGLALWRGCTQMTFARLELADLAIDRRGLTLCPPPGSAILRSNDAGLRIAAGTNSLDLAGRLGETPIRIAADAVGFALPGNLSVRSLDIALGREGEASHFTVSNLAARLGGEVAGTFSDADIGFSAVPFDLKNASGNWAWREGRLELSDAQFTVEDRQLPWRFAPLAARGGRLVLKDSAIEALASLREPASDREVAAVTIAHDLASGAGQADFAVDNLRFDNRLQPDTLTPLALGIIANADGVVNGSGEFVWDANGVTRSGGRFSTDSFDFAAAFGPVRGASGAVVFTDLVNPTTAPDQEIRLASVNPGIEALDGRLGFELRDGEFLRVTGGIWPFLGGTLRLMPATMRLGVAEERRYTLVIEALDAARFVEHMDLANIGATGIFDGTLPLVFDEDGGRIEGGLLASRLPGGNVSYVGELTYEDLSPMANFAFETLKSLDYRTTSIAMDGPLTGELVTRVRFDGVRQGAGTKSNIVTRHIAKLPVRFNVNIRAPFYNLITNIRAMYDPAYIRDPRDLGLVDSNGNAVRSDVGRPSAGLPADEAGIQQ